MPCDSPATIWQSGPERQGHRWSQNPWCPSTPFHCHVPVSPVRTKIPAPMMAAVLIMERPNSPNTCNSSMIRAAQFFVADAVQQQIMHYRPCRPAGLTNYTQTTPLRHIYCTDAEHRQLRAPGPTFFILVSCCLGAMWGASCPAIRDMKLGPRHR